jgi:protein-S-isoprenylcysteine O-methyltransferase Ste14
MFGLHILSFILSLSNRPTHILHKIFHIAEILLAMSGVVVRRMTLLRMVSVATSLALYAYCASKNSFTLAVWYFVAATVFHYVLLVGMFAPLPRNWSMWCIQKFGEERGFRIYEAWMAIAFFHNGISTALMCAATQGTLLQYVPQSLLTGLGITLSCVGLPVKVWATRIVGIDTYYYRDLFLRRTVGTFKVAGPYRFLKNPMYSVGHLHGYGTALVAGSLPGLLIVGLNQACVWLFYWFIEKPHVETMYGSGATKDFDGMEKGL